MKVPWMLHEGGFFHRCCLQEKSRERCSSRFVHLEHLLRRKSSPILGMYVTGATAASRVRVPRG